MLNFKMVTHKWAASSRIKIHLTQQIPNVGVMMCKLKDFELLDILPEHRGLLEHELEAWHRDYLPVKRGATVLDLGAGCGETALFYLNHGAGKVIAIEGNPKAYAKLKKNFRNNPRVLPLRAMINKIKCDIEGGEEDMVVETHFPLNIQRERIAWMSANKRLIDKDEVLLFKFKRNSSITGKFANLWNIAVCVLTWKIKL